MNREGLNHGLQNGSLPLAESRSLFSISEETVGKKYTTKLNWIIYRHDHSHEDMTRLVKY